MHDIILPIRGLSHSRRVNICIDHTEDTIFINTPIARITISLDIDDRLSVTVFEDDGGVAYLKCDQRQDEY